MTTVKKTLLIPPMCDHAYVLSAALSAHNVPSRVMPPSDEESLSLGLDLVSGKECLPCLVSTGDIIRYVQREKLDPAHSAVLMPTAQGPCRFGQYHVLQRSILDQHGLHELEILSPTAANSYQGFGDHPTAFRKLAWEGMVALDTLQKLRHEYRPYEEEPGTTDRLYQYCQDRIVAAVGENGGRRLVQAMAWIGSRFDFLPVNRSQRRPVIGMVGEIFLRFSDFANQDLIRQIEAAGGEVVLASMMEWLYYTNWAVKKITRYLGRYRDHLLMSLVDVYQRSRERRVVRPVAHLLTFPYETPISHMMEPLRDYGYEPYLGTEAVLSMGKAIEFAGSGLSGIVNVMPFGCMPGLITAGMGPHLRAGLDQIPWLDVIYDGQGSTNIQTRLQAFLHQTAQYQRRRPDALSFH